MDQESDAPWIAGGAAVLAVALTLAACTDGTGTACPAIGWSNAVVVVLDDEWPPVEGGSLTVDCSPLCGSAAFEGEPLSDQEEASAPPHGATAVLQLDMSAPESVSIRVLGADGAGLAAVDADLDWRRVGGSEACGGPMEATVTVPAP